MDSSFSTLGFLIFGVTLCFYAFVVQSEITVVHIDRLASPAPPSPPPPPPPPPPPESPPPPPPPRHRRSPPPPHSAHRPPPPPPESPPTPSDAQASELRSPRDHHGYWIPPPPPSRQQSGMNTGKKVGLLFVGIVAVMQIAMVSFLVFQRNQLLKGNDRYENYS